MKFPTVFAAALLLIFKSQAQSFKFPEAEKIAVQDTFFKQEVITDHYRWLENIHSPKSKAWLAKQEELTVPYLKKLQSKHNSFIAIDRIAYSEFSHPRKMGKYYLGLGYYDNQATPALLYKQAFDQQFELLLNPNTIDIQVRVEIKSYAISKNSDLLAVQYSKNGSDWNDIQVISLPSGALKKDLLKNIKFSTIAWKGNGFFYSTYPRSGDFDKIQGQKIYYHTMGTPQEEDKLIFERNNPALRFEFQVTSDERFFVLKELNKKTWKDNFFYIDYQDPQPALKPLLINLKYYLEILDSRGGKFIATSNSEDNTNNIIEIDPANPLKWRNVVPKFTKSVLLEAIPLKEKILAVYQTKHMPTISIFDYSGNILYNLELPIGTSVSGFMGSPTDHEFLFHMTSYIFPPIVYSLNINTYERKVTNQTKVNFSHEDLEIKETEVTAQDGAKIPMLLVHKRGLKLNGSNPAIISAYGGFGIVATPAFDPGIVYFVKQGGVFAFANIRGSGNLGTEWAWAGRGANKQTSFDDFIACSEFLITKGYTNAGKLAATGTSNGGLVVAAAAIKRPDLYKAVVPVVAPLDMLRFEKFTVGNFHTSEYGTVSEQKSFNRLRSYSPYHTIKEEVNYPAMLVVTSDNDDRVPPFHSYKFVARLQNRTAQTQPVLLSVEQNAGHYGGATISRVVREKAEVYGFMMEFISK